MSNNELSDKKQPIVEKQHRNPVLFSYSILLAGLFDAYARIGLTTYGFYCYQGKVTMK